MSVIFVTKSTVQSSPAQRHRHVAMHAVINIIIRPRSVCCAARRYLSPRGCRVEIRKLLSRLKVKVNCRQNLITFRVHHIAHYVPISFCILFDSQY